MYFVHVMYIHAPAGLSSRTHYWSIMHCKHVRLAIDNSASLPYGAPVWSVAALNFQDGAGLAGPLACRIISWLWRLTEILSICSQRRTKSFAVKTLPTHPSFLKASMEIGETSLMIKRGGRIDFEFGGGEATKRFQEQVQLTYNEDSPLT